MYGLFFYVLRLTAKQKSTRWTIRSFVSQDMFLLLVHLCRNVPKTYGSNSWFPFLKMISSDILRRRAPHLRPKNGGPIGENYWNPIHQPPWYCCGMFWIQDSSTDMSTSFERIMYNKVNNIFLKYCANNVLLLYHTLFCGSSWRSYRFYLWLWCMSM